MDRFSWAEARIGWLRSAELWLTPLIGLPLLTIYMIPHDFKLAGQVAFAVFVGAIPLLATGVVQRLLRGLRWYGWAQVLAAGVVGCLAVSVCYYYALYPAEFAIPVTTDAEGRGNDIALYNLQTQNFGIIGAVAGVASAVMAMVWRMVGRWLGRG